MAFGQEYQTLNSLSIDGVTERRAIGFDDPEVQNRLRDLGYLED
jgi:hypothetical protein